jgi:hypothetical protein
LNLESRAQRRDAVEPATDLPPGRSGWLTKLEWGGCLAATLAAIWLHVLYLTHLGGLWRDETHGVHLATMGTVGEMLRWLTRDSFPVLFPSIIRLWSGLGLGGSDFGLRCLGLLVGLCILGAVWLNARVLSSSLPFVSLGLLAANLTVVRWGDSLRAYGLGSVFTLLTLASVWSLMRTPSAGRFFAALLAAILSVQCLYQNAFLLFAICAAGCFVCLRCRQDTAALLVVAVGGGAALSLLPYIGPVLTSQRWWVVQQTGFHATRVWSTLADALGNPMIWQIPIWLALVVAAAVRGVLSLPNVRRPKPIRPKDLPLFAAITISLGVPVFFIFVAISRLPTQPWYWLPLLVPIAVCVDAALAGSLARHRAARLVFVVLMVFVPLVTGVSLAKYRQTNIDVIAARVGELAKPDDLILVHPWYCGVTFNRYYKGQARWTTLPPLSDWRLHRYDLVKEKLAATEPIKPVLDQIAQTLGAGNRLWIVGNLPPAEPDEKVTPDLPPAPEGPSGWFDVPYSYVWGRQADLFITAQGRHIESIPTGADDRVNELERASLGLVKR